MISILLAAGDTGFRPLVVVWLVGSIYYICRILTFTIFIRVILSWFMTGRGNLLLTLLDDITGPVLNPLRRIVPRLGVFDFTPMIAIAILYFIPFIISLILT
ncbi:YggT family protein [Chloroflexota bacterium]